MQPNIKCKMAVQSTSRQVYLRAGHELCIISTFINHSTDISAIHNDSFTHHSYQHSALATWNSKPMKSRKVFKSASLENTGKGRLGYKNAENCKKIIYVRKQTMTKTSLKKSRKNDP